MNIVFDTNVLISSTLWNNSVAQKLLFKMVSLDMKIFSSKEILEEYEKVLQRDFGYSIDEITRIFEKISPTISLVMPVEKVDVVKSDPDDNKIIECALSSNADYIITYDKHLLEIVEFNGIKIIKPEALLNQL